MIDINDIDIFIPTYNRIGKMSTHLLFDNCLIVCPQAQYEMYKDKYQNLKFMCCPDEIDGNIARKRNWIKDNSSKKYIVMVDDDIKGFKYIEKSKKINMNKEQIIKMILNGFQVMEDVGTIMWGINLNDDPKCYEEYRPFSFLSPILGPFTAQKNINDIRYDERLSLKEDYDLSLQVINKFHKVVRFNKYSYNACHIDLSGGCFDYRSMVKEIKQKEILIKKWGSKVIKFRDNSINPIVKVPLKGV